MLCRVAITDIDADSKPADVFLALLYLMRPLSAQHDVDFAVVLEGLSVHPASSAVGDPVFEALADQ